MTPDKPEIEYPCPWSFRILGTSEEIVRTVIAEIVGDEAHELHFSNTSSGGKYVALRLELEVRDEVHRLELYRRLAARNSIVAVL